MKYCGLIAHMEELPKYKKGDVVNPGAVLGLVGNTGASKGKHVHIQDAVGWFYKPFHSWDFEMGRVRPAPEQTLLMISGGYSDIGLFGCEPKIESPFYSSAYLNSQKKQHYGFDVNPLKAGFNKIHWNRSINAIVLDIGNDPGFGFYIILGYKAG